MRDVVDYLNEIIWSSWLIYLCLGAGLYFSIRTRFMQVRGVAEMLRLMLKGKGSDAGISSFQALSVSLSGRIGIGNIAGVATAIHFGGPGAVFWMWMVAFLGASTAYIESTLGQIYKEKDTHGRYRGGPAFYIEKAMKQKWYAVTFAVTTVVATGFLLPGVQANGIAAGVAQAWGVAPEISAAVLVLALGLIIFGGIARIARVAELIVPLMSIGYIAVALFIVARHYERLLDVLQLILNSAFGMHAGYGALLGLAIQWGVKRGIYSNEAGQGTGPHPAAAAEVSHPAAQGYVQAFSVYVDTLFVCSATAFMVLLSGKYNVMSPSGELVVENLSGVEAGPGYTQAAVESVLPGMGASFVAVALTFFAFTTIIAYYYMAETNIEYLNRHASRNWMMMALKLGMMLSVAYGSMRSATLAWALGDLGVGLMAWLNIIAILILQRPALRALRDYERQRKQGIEPTFRPGEIGIADADFWAERAGVAAGQPQATLAVATSDDAAELKLSAATTLEQQAP
jgi:AGCS family alanine or glycine:cation symporter